MLLPPHCGSKIAPNSPFIYAWCRETMQGSKVRSGRRGKPPVLLVWMYVVCHPCLVAQEDALPRIIPLLFPSRRPLLSRWSVTEELCFVLSLSCGAKGSYFGGHRSTSSIYGCQKAQIAHTNCLQTPPARAQVVVP